ncbi:alpha/beta fold hydrolase [Chloroflexota bacterium]
MSIVILKDEIVHYEVLGRGRPLIFLHGWVGSWRYWIPAMQAASISFRTYAIDLWGFGDTAKVVDNYSLEQQVNLLDEFLQEMGIGKIALIGHGLGAVIGMLYAYRYRKFVDRVMAISMPNGRHSLNQRMYSDAPMELAEWLLGRTTDGEAARGETTKADQRAIQFSLANLKNIEMSTLSQNLTTPCLMVYGQNDPAVEEIKTQDPFSEQAAPPDLTHEIVFEQSGHFPMLDEPTKFHRLVADFLSLSSGTSPKQLSIKEEWKRRVR